MTQPALKNSKAAIWSLILGILSMGCLWLLGSIPAIILGVIGLKKTSGEPPEATGKGLAIAGMVTGSIGIISGIFTLGIIAAIALPATTGIQQEARSAVIQNEMKALAIAIQSYSITEGRYPESLNQLSPAYLSDDDQLTAGEVSNGTPMPYLYRPEGFSTDTPSASPVLLSPFEVNMERVIGYADGSTKALPAPLDPAITALFGK